MDPRTVAVVRTLAIFALIAAFVYAARDTLLLLLFAVFFAYLIEPAVSRVERWPKLSSRSRGLAIAEVYVVLGLICTGILWGVGPSVTSEGQHLIAAAPNLLDPSSLDRIVRQVGNSHGWSYRTQLGLEHLISAHRQEILSAVRNGAARVESLVTNIFWVVLVPILAVFILSSGPEFAESGIRILQLRPHRRAFLKVTLRDLNDMAAHYVRAQMLLAAFALPVYTLVLVASRLQYGLVLGLFAGALEFIPLVGPLVAAISILAVAFLTGYQHVWVLLLFLGCWRIVQDYVNAPKLMHKTVKLHPFTVILAVLAGAEIAGIIGVFLSIPVAAALQIFWRRWRTASLAVQDEPDAGQPQRRVA
jgi:predicted PurR-regulated permease PerM